MSTEYAGSNEDAKSALKKSLETVMKCVETLFKIVKNAKNGEDAKFKSIKKTNSVFKRYIAEVDGACEVLVAAGFDDDHEQLRLNSRQDPGLLYLICSLLESIVDVTREHM
jgi:hypothetical protein